MTETSNSPSSTSSLCSIETEESPKQYDSELSQAFQKILEKTKKPMDALQQRVYKYIIEIDQHLEHLTQENQQLKGAMRMKDANINQLKTEKASSLLQKSNADLNEQLSIVTMQKTEIMYLQTKLHETRTVMAKHAVKLKAYQREVRKLCDTIEGQDHELQMCKNAKREMSEKIFSLESAIRDEKAINEELTMQLKSLEQKMVKAQEILYQSEELINIIDEDRTHSFRPQPQSSSSPLENSLGDEMLTKKRKASAIDDTGSQTNKKAENKQRYTTVNSESGIHDEETTGEEGKFMTNNYQQPHHRNIHRMVRQDNGFPI